MFTDNYIKYRRMMFTGIGKNASTNMINTAGASKTVYGIHSHQGDVGYYMRRGRCSTIPVDDGSNNHSSYDEMKQGLYFGSGSTPPTKSDYTLEAPITSGLAITNPSGDVTIQSGNVYSFVADFVVRNNTTAPVTIREVGIFTACSTSTNTSIQSVTMDYFLMERTVLDTPVTIPAGESRLIEYKITFDHGA